MEEKNIVKKVSIISVISNFLLLLLKLVVSIISKSQAMLADSLNSAGDIVASVVSYIGAKVSAKPKDYDHPHGHGKAEYVFTIVISLCMIIASLSMISSSIKSILNHSKMEFSIKLIAICIITILVKITLFIYTKKVLKKTSSILIKANNEDHRNDIFITSGTLISIILSYLGYNFVDGIVGILISIWIIYVGLKLFYLAYTVLMDTSLGINEQNELVKFIEENDEILHVDSIISKPTGSKFIIIIKLSMDGTLTLEHSHQVIGKIKDDIAKKYDYVEDIIIHVNPH